MASASNALTSDVGQGGPAERAYPRLEPIGDAQLVEFCEFLHANLNARIAVRDWVGAFEQRWASAKPNNGFLLRGDNGRVVGGIGAIYADRMIRGRPERFCNITSWCVLDEYRSQSLRLASALLAQPGYHFTDFTPTELVARSLKFLKFRPMDATHAIVPNIPWWDRAVRVVSAAAAVERILPPSEAKVFRDHLHFGWLRHVVVDCGGNVCYVSYKRGSVKHLPCATLLYVSDPVLFVRFRFVLGAYFLFRHGMVATRVEARLLPYRMRWAAHVNGGHQKLFRSPELNEADVTDFYSELVALNL